MTNNPSKLLFDSSESESQTQDTPKKRSYTVKTIIELNEKDIATIIAEKFNCRPEEVTVHVEKSYAGHGHMEHEVLNCHAKVTKKTEVK